MSVILSAAFLLGAFWALSSLGTLTYSPRFHKPRYVAFSFVLYTLLATVLVSTGYLVFVYAYATRLPKSAAEIAIGCAFVSFITFVLATTHYAVLRQYRDYSSKKQLIDEVLDTAESITTCERDVLPRKVRTLDAKLQELERCLQKESASEVEKLRTSISEWRSELIRATDSGVRKMIDDTTSYGEGDVVDTDPHWEEKRKNFEHIHNDLHNMRESALRKLDPRHD